MCTEAAGRESASGEEMPPPGPTGRPGPPAGPRRAWPPPRGVGMVVGADFRPCSQVKFNEVQGNNDPHLQLDTVDTLLFDLIARLPICENPHFWGLKAEG